MSRLNGFIPLERQRSESPNPLTIQGGESVAKPRIGAISIDDFAYIRSAKAAEEWRNAAEKAELKSDPFPVVG
jgi:hypothetical protein